MATSNFTGKSIAGYTIGDLIARGGMGAIFHVCSSVPTLEPLAIKILRPDFNDSDEFRKRFEREAYLLMTLDHEHIVPVYDFGHADGLTFLVMRLIRGPSLFQFQANQHFTPQTVQKVLDPLAAALDYAHDKGVIHRDIKPGNVLIEHSDEPLSRVFLTDFGLSKAHGDPALTLDGKSMGTPQYMSPEQVMDYPLDRRSDIYALGLLVYEMLLGRLPFYGKSAQHVAFRHVKDMPPPPRQLNASFPPILEEVLMQALAKSPKHRFGAAGDFTRAYGQALARTRDNARHADYWVGPPASV